MKPSDDLSTCTDEDLLARFRQGRREAFAVLVKRYERELYGYLRRYLGDGNLADDVFQNTFLTLYTKIGHYEQGRPVRPWLYTIATHQAIDALRRVGRQAMVSIDRERDESADGELHKLSQLLTSNLPNPLIAAELEERRQLVRESVERLPDFLRQVVVLAYYQGLKYRDVAEILGIPVGTVKSRLHTALVRLHEAWSAAPSLQE